MIDAEDELRKVREYRQRTRRRPYHTSRLARYRAEIVALRRAGAAYADIQVWLRRNTRTRVAVTTIMRYLQTLPELHHEDHAGLRQT